MTFRFRTAIAQPAAALNFAALALAVLAATPSVTQAFPITPQQRETANQVAAKGVPLSELTENAPDTYTVKRGDTLTSIARLYNTSVAALKSSNPRTIVGNRIQVGDRLTILLTRSRTTTN